MSIVVSVRQTVSSYVATAFGARAFSTMSPDAAVERLAEKIFGPHQRITIYEKYPDRATLSISEWEIEVDETQACRMCGCTYTSPCSPEGCHWVEVDLCSACAGGAV